MKTLLIPTDFKLESLNSIPELVERFYPNKINIVLVHMMQITDCIQELLMLSRRSTEYRHISQEFYDACTSLKQEHEGVVSNIRIDFFYGSTVAVFKNFLEANDVDVIVLLNNYDYKLLNKNSLEPSLLVNRSGKEVIYTDWKPRSKSQSYELTASLSEQKVLS